MKLRRGSFPVLAVLVVLAAGCTFPDASMVASNGASGTTGGGVPADESGDSTGNTVTPGDAGLREDDADSGTSGTSGSSGTTSGATGSDGAAGNVDATAASADGSVGLAMDASAPVDAAEPSTDGATGSDTGVTLADASSPRPDAASGVDAGHDAGQKQYPIDIDCTSVDLDDCNSTLGFTGDPDCGATGTLVQCGTSTTRSTSNGNGNGDDNEASSRAKSCVVLLQLSAVQTCL